MLKLQGLKGSERVHQLDFGVLAIDSGQKVEVLMAENSDCVDLCALPIEKTCHARTRSKSPIRKSGQSLPAVKQFIKTSKPIKGLPHVANNQEALVGNSSMPLCLQQTGLTPSLPAPLNQQVP